jgi:hypothetical protein
MNRYLSLIVFLAWAGGLLAVSPLPAAELPSDLGSFLKEKLGLKGDELDAVESGKAVVRLVDASDEREVALAGAVRLDVPAGFVGESYREMLSSMKGPRLKSLGIFGTPALPEDVAGLTFPASDLDDLQKCVAGDCKIKLYTEDIEKVKSEIDWQGEDAQAQVDAVLREDAVSLVEDYRKRGDAAIPDYADKEQLMNAATGFDFLLRESPLLFEYLPEFFDSIRAYPQDQLQNVDDFVFWTVENPGSGLKETIFLTHAFVYSSKTKDGLPFSSIVQKRLHASHYYYAALRSATVIDYSDGAKPLSYMVFLDRHLFDGKLGGFKKRMLRNGLKEGLEEELSDIQRRVREAYRAKSGG